MKKFLERIFLTTLFFLVLSVFIGIASELRVYHDPASYAQHMLLPSGSLVKRALFSPDDDVKSVLIGLINEEKSQISMAIFSLTDKDIAQALLEAHDRNVIVEIVTDRTTCMAEYSKIPLLAKKGITLYVYPKVKDIDKRGSSLMHNKFIIFSSSLRNKTLLWTGSFNLSRAASYSNQENVVVLDDAALVTPYIKRFSLIKQRSDLLAGTPRVAPQLSSRVSLLAWLKQLMPRAAR
jgi:phosphatidylserine/phosphatidylglycerophosphate/cardiolipin synthase-like enzyme